MEELQATLDRKIAAWEGMPLSMEPGANGAERAFRRDLVELLVNNRLEWIALLREGKPDALVDRLQSFFARWAGSLGTLPPLDETRRVTVRLMYRNLISLIASVLAENGESETLRAALGNCIDYHMAGLAAVMDKWRKE